MDIAALEEEIIAFHGEAAGDVEAAADADARQAP